MKGERRGIYLDVLKLSRGKGNIYPSFFLDVVGGMEWRGMII